VCANFDAWDALFYWIALATLTFLPGRLLQLRRKMVRHQTGICLAMQTLPSLPSDALVR